MAEPTSQRADADVGSFLASVADERRRADAQAICAWLREVTGEEPAMHGSAIVGFGRHR
ncbi:MAG: hypothetical protein H0W25_13955 [Acidimicrobiia bacterium]|nr:hypothetical protein [Acidimicrobiia bacterium]